MSKEKKRLVLFCVTDSMSKKRKNIYILNSGRSKVAIIINYSVFLIGTDVDMRCEPGNTNLLNKIETE